MLTDKCDQKLALGHVIEFEPFLFGMPICFWLARQVLDHALRYVKAKIVCKVSSVK